MSQSGASPRFYRSHFCRPAHPGGRRRVQARLFRKRDAPGGVCAACHTPHYAKALAAEWPRDLAEEATYFNQTSNPDYVRGDTIFCYDCHDNHDTVDNNPPDSLFSLTRIAQDVAFDDDMMTTVPRDGLPDDNKLGYYEKPTSGTAISGHYVKYPPGGSQIEQGDKLPCNDCHNPHDTTNQAFIRKKLADKTLVGIKASTFMAYAEIQDGRNDADSRKFCIACHGTSEQTIRHGGDVRHGQSPVRQQQDRRSAELGERARFGVHDGLHLLPQAQQHGRDLHGLPRRRDRGGGEPPTSGPTGWGRRPRGTSTRTVRARTPGMSTRSPRRATVRRRPRRRKTRPATPATRTRGARVTTTNTAGSPAGTADVHRDPQNPATHFKNIAGAANGVQTESYDNAVGRERQGLPERGLPLSGVHAGDGSGDSRRRRLVPAAGGGDVPEAATGTGRRGRRSPTRTRSTWATSRPRRRTAAGTATRAAWETPTYTVSHQTGVVEWDFTNTLDPGGTRTETYNGLATGTTAVKYGAGAFSTCAGAYCHIQTSPPWNAAIGATGCTLCHQTGQTAAPNPSSGLHYGSTPPTVSGSVARRHAGGGEPVRGLSHVGAHPGHPCGRHLQRRRRPGTWPGWACSPPTRRRPTGWAPAPEPRWASAGCHDGGDGGSWARPWDAAINYATNGSECQGCHGGFGQPTDTPAYGWTFGATHNAADGSTEHAYNWDGDARGPEVMTSHQACKVCHGANSATDTHANYVAGTGFWRGKAGDATSMHGDGSIQMNGPSPGSGAGYDQTIWGCSNVPACHGSEWAGGTYPSRRGAPRWTIPAGRWPR